MKKPVSGGVRIYNYRQQITAMTQQLTRLGYSDATIAHVVTVYTGCDNIDRLSVNQQRRLADDLKRYVRIARKWHYCQTGRLE